MPDTEKQSQRGTIFVEDAEILLLDSYPGEQYVLRPVSYTHLRAHET